MIFFLAAWMTSLIYWDISAVDNAVCFFIGMLNLVADIYLTEFYDAFADAFVESLWNGGRLYIDLTLNSGSVCYCNGFLCSYGSAEF